ncbi:MAG: hypothetical protein ACI90V_002421 [Bacillariaceae sp.]
MYHSSYSFTCSIGINLIFIFVFVSLKDSNCLKQFSSYRATFELPSDKWTTVKLPWTIFDGFGPGAVDNVVDQSNLRRIGLVAYGKKMDVTLALSSIRLF